MFIHILIEVNVIRCILFLHMFNEFILFIEKGEMLVV